MNQSVGTFAIICFLVGLYAKSFACSCDGKYAEYKYAVKKSNLIFSGKVVRIATDFVNTKYGQQVVKTYKIVPERIWLGAPADTISFPYNELDCFSQYLEIGKKYILFTKMNQQITF